MMTNQLECGGELIFQKGSDVLEVVGGQGQKEMGKVYGKAFAAVD